MRLEQLLLRRVVRHIAERCCHAKGNVVRHAHGPPHLAGFGGSIALPGQLMHACCQVIDSVLKLAARNVRSFTHTQFAETAETTTQQCHCIGWVMPGRKGVWPVEDAIILQKQCHRHHRHVKPLAMPGHVRQMHPAKPCCDPSSCAQSSNVSQCALAPHWDKRHR